MTFYYKDTEKGRLWTSGAGIWLKDGRCVSNPTIEMLSDEGWQLFVPSEPTLFEGTDPVRKDFGLEALYEIHPESKELLHKIENGIVFHYTTWETLFKGILSTENINKKQLVLRAYSVNYMNDNSEGLLIPDALSRAEDNNLVGKTTRYLTDNGVVQCPANETPFRRRWKEARRQNAIQSKQYLFSVSFSRLSDSLPMWHYYAHQGNGLSIGFDAFEIYNQGYDLFDCIYDPSTIDKLGEWFHDCKRDTVPSLALNILAKDSHFEYEKECRITLCRFGKHYCITKRDQFHPIRFDIKGGVIAPYVDVLLPLKAIKEIWIGPTNHMDLAEDSLRGWLESVGLSSITICKSSAPLV